MSRNSFLSIVVPISSDQSLNAITEFIEIATEKMVESFQDYEIIFVDNRSGLNMDLLDIDQTFLQNCYIIKLASKFVRDMAILAGLERANGDYVTTFDISFINLIDYIPKLYDEAQRGFDVTYLRVNKKAWQHSFKRNMFYALLTRLSQEQVDPTALRSYMFSRRATNSVIRKWHATTFLSEAAFGSGYQLSSITVERDKLGITQRRESRDEKKLAWGALIRNTNFPFYLGQIAITVMGVICIFSVINALIVRFFGHNIFGYPEIYVPGWTFVVILVSGGLLLTNIALYALLRTLYVLIDGNQNEAKYIVERYGRL